MIKSDKSIIFSDLFEYPYFDAEIKNIVETSVSEGVTTTTQTLQHLNTPVLNEINQNLFELKFLFIWFIVLVTTSLILQLYIFYLGKK